MTLSAPLANIEMALIEWQDVATLIGGFYPLFGLLCLCWSLHLFRQNLAQRHRLRQFAISETSNRTRLRDLLDSVSDLVFVLTREGRILELNKAAARIFGEKTGAMSGGLLTSRVLVRDHPKLLRLFSEDGAKEGDASPELSLCDERGFTHVIKITTWKQAGPEREGGFFVVARNLTALKAMEAAWSKSPESEPPFPRLGSNDIWFRGE
ncbi:MAG: PAS domain-containing protein [Pedosphaera sp.]|nr:PAS domain-containing protein [Pedosphaera sp.]